MNIVPETVPAEGRAKLEAYEVTGPLAAGGVATVWSALHRERGEAVVVKAMTAQQSREPFFKGQFEAEVDALTRLSHPRIIALIEYGTVSREASSQSMGKDSPFLVLEQAHGDLREWARAPQHWEDLRGALAQILEALAHTHAQGLIHRDIKPANILCMGERIDDGLKLADFGLAWNFQTPCEAEPTPIGSPAYMAPEQITGSAADWGPWTDLYALGCLAWELTTGHTPFEHASSVLYGRLNGRLPLFQPRKPCPAGFAAWLRRMLAREPSQRYRSAEHALADLRALGKPTRKSLLNRNEPAWPLPTGPAFGMDTVPVWGHTCSLPRTQPVAG